MVNAEDPLTAFTFAALYLFLPSVLLTHGLGLIAHFPRSAKLKHILLYPVLGGRHHRIFQTLSWVIWTVSILVALPVVVSRPSWVEIPRMHVEVLSGAAAVGSVFAELFMIKSLLVFDPEAHNRKGQAPLNLSWNVALMPSKSLAAVVVVVMGMMWAFMGGALLLATEYLVDTETKQLYFSLSGACLLIGATTTHGLGGQLAHRAPGQEAKGWRFFQPFRGGAVFVATQGLGWALFSASLVSLLWLIMQVAAGMAYCIRCWALATSSVMFAAQLMLAASIWTFKGSSMGGKSVVLAQPVSRLAIWLPIMMLYTPVHIFCCIVVTSFFVMPPSFASALWAGSLMVYYGITGFGEPEHTGKREWPPIQAYMHRHIERALAAWFGSVEVVRDCEEEFLPTQKYIFGYAPHGLFPIGAGYLPHMPSFQKLLPGIRPVTLVASVCFFPPVVRDLCSWCGLRQVSRRTFVRALAERGSVMMVPGGQAELVHTWRMFRAKRDYVIYTRHKGFVRMAIEQGAHLVPVVVLGEVQSLRNLIDLPDIQQWTYKKLGFPIPYLLVGRWGFSPLPRQTGLKFLIGRPISPPAYLPGDKISEEAVTKLHDEFYGSVEKLFLKHKDSFPGYEDVNLVMSGSVTK